MRVQQQQQSLRLRIQEQELTTLLRGEPVVNETRWPDGQRQRQRLLAGARLAWQREPDGWCLTVPANEVRELASRLPSREGLAWSLGDDSQRALEVRFDVDVRDSTRKRYGHSKP